MQVRNFDLALSLFHQHDLIINQQQIAEILEPILEAEEAHILGQDVIWFRRELFVRVTCGKSVCFLISSCVRLLIWMWMAFYLQIAVERLCSQAPQSA